MGKTESVKYKKKNCKIQYELVSKLKTKQGVNDLFNISSKSH